MYWNLFLTFFRIGLVSFGGGYAMLPLIEYEVKSNNWLTTQQLTDAIAIAGMSPGPIATNSAVFVGYNVGGILGAIISAIAISFPSLIIVVLIALFVSKVKSNHSIISYVFYGLRPVITALIVYAAINFAIQNNIIQGISLIDVDWISIVFVFIALAMLLFTKLSPVIIIFLSGLAGIIVYY
ncbi:chromate transporter [Oceanobacillus polygoni]|uniref:Chromate transporter n=1 Tax=Oceanobacillus polygoni TaxID=1235259 RepID=A0A9X1CEA1_9BACI|nr:chromate transporter [Oceanobacillus polygoni]MBP2076033.1 chromate transporter [Oceanobacillus polygoni]